MKSNVFSTIMAGFESMWRGSRLITIAGVIQLLIAAYLITVGTGTDQVVSWCGLGLAVASMAIAQFSLAARIGIEASMLDLEQKKFEIILSRFNAVSEKLDNLENYIINEKLKE